MLESKHASPFLAALVAAFALGGCGQLRQQQPVDGARTATTPVDSMDARAGRAGYLSPEAIVNSAALSPPPPAAGSAAQALDDETSRKYLAMEGSPRFEQAALDAQFRATFDCALNVPISRTATPILYRLLERSVTDVGMSTAAAKDLYRRPRPFMVNGRSTCLAGQDERLRDNGSYPSGHSAVGWAFALLLAEISPERAPAILARGRSFAQSRIACNVHWYSDTIEGVILGSAAVARLHAEPAFVADLALARSELAAVRAKGAAPTNDCKAEAEALKE